MIRAGAVLFAALVVGPGALPTTAAAVSGATTATVTTAASAAAPVTAAASTTAPALPATTATTSPTAATAQTAAVPPPPWPGTAAGVTVEAMPMGVAGLGWTKTEPLREAMDTRPGAPYDPRMLRADLQRLRDYEIFREVTATVYPRSASAVTVDVTVTDRWGIVPVFRPVSGGGIYSLKLGIRDTNFLGRNQDVAVYAGPYVSPASKSYLLGLNWLWRQFLGRHTGYLSLTRDYGVSAFYGDRASPRTNIEVVVASGFAEMVYELNDWIKPGAYLSVSERRYTLLGGPALPTGIPDRAFGVRPGAVLRLGDVNFDHYRYTGADLFAGAFHEVRTAGPEGFTGGFVRGRWFLLPHPRINLAFRAMAEARGNAHPIDDLSYSGLGHVRGFPNGYLRGNRMALLNAELRVTVFHSLFDLIWGQAVVFYDVAAAGHGSVIDGWERSAQGVGVGIRGAIVKIYGMFLRVDVGQSISDGRLGPDVGLDIAQFF